MTLSADHISEKMNTELIKSLPVAIYTCDPDGTISYFNEAAAELWQQRPVIGQDLWCGAWKLFTPNGEPMALADSPMARTILGKKPVSGEEIIVERPDHTRANILPHPALLHDDEGRLVGAINMLVNITEQRKAEEALRETENRYRTEQEQKIRERSANLTTSEERYHKMIEEVQDYAIILLDRHGNILNWNKGAQQIKGYKESEILGKNFRIFYGEQDRLDKLPERLIGLAVANGKAAHEGWRMRKDGTRFWGSIVITALHDNDHNVIGFSKVTRDLTEKKLADDRMAAYAKDISFQNKQLESYAYIASHDLQEPLRKIRIFTDMLLKGPAEQAQTDKLLQKINSAAERMSDLIKDILSYSQVSQAELLFTQVDLNEVIASVRQDYELLLEERKVTFTTDKLPVIKGIPIQLRQLFANLISNSIKFSEKDPMITVSSEKMLTGDESKIPALKPRTEYVHICFTDNGIGFEAEYADRVFELFNRLNKEKTGTGIGLAICKKIAENHNGYISVSSTPGEGTTFDIYLPI